MFSSGEKLLVDGLYSALAEARGGQTAMPELAAPFPMPQYEVRSDHHAEHDREVHLNLKNLRNTARRRVISKALGPLEPHGRRHANDGQSYQMPHHSIESALL